MSTTTPRRAVAVRLLAAFAAGLALLGTSARAADAADNVLNIYNWSDYIAPDTVPNFEKQFGVKVRYDTYDTNETPFAKLVAGDSGYDIIVPTANWAAIDIMAGFALPLDKSRIPNLKNLDPELMRMLGKVVDPGNKYLVPWMWGYVTVGINVDKVRKALGGKPLPANPWDLVFNPLYADRLKSCGVSMLDSGTEVMEAAFNYMGIPQATHDQGEFERAFAMLQKVRPDIAELSSSGYINDLAGGSLCVSLGYSGDMGIAAYRAQQAHNGQNIEVFPPSHGAVLTVDTMMIPAHAKHVDNAYKFINYRLQPRVVANDTNAVSFANPVPASLPLVAPRVRDSGYVFLAPAMMKKLIPPKIYTAEERREVTRLYTRFKTGI